MGLHVSSLGIRHTCRCPGFASTGIGLPNYSGCSGGIAGAQALDY